MPLQLVAVPIGHSDDITRRAITALEEADVVVGEERKEASKLLRSLGITGKRLELLNEHSTEDEVRELAELCRDQRVALVTDCGTPGFCDPGARLVRACRTQGVKAAPLPGASSLMCLLSMCGVEMREFLFRGFLPAEREAREAALRDLSREKRPIVLMDTPYRLKRLLEELARTWPERRAVLGCDFTQESETIIEANLKDMPSLVGDRKAEFVMAVFPPSGSVAAKNPTPQPGVQQRKDSGRIHRGPGPWNNQKRSKR